MRYTRRGLLAGAAAGALAATGIYEAVDRLATSPPRADALGLPPEQHLLDLRVVHDDGIAVLVPPLHHQLVTAKVRATDLVSAQRELEDALADLDARFPSTPAGLGVTVAWGLPYFERRVAARLDGARAVRPAGRQARAAPGDPLSERPARHRPRAERRRRPAAQRLARQRLGRREAALRRSRRLRADEHSQGVRRRRLRGAPEPAEADGDGRERARRRPDPGHRRALPRLHVDPAGEPRPGPDREPRDARLHGRGRRLLPRRHPHARLAHLRGPRGLVPELRLPAAGGHDLPPGAEGAPGRADGRAGPRPGDRHEARSSATSAGAGGSATARRSRRRRASSATRSAPTEPSTARAPRSRSAPISTPSTTPSSGGPRASTARRRPASTSSSSTRRATTSTAIAWRWTGCCRTGRDCRSSPGRAPRA